MFLLYLGFYAIGPIGKWLVEFSIIVSQVGKFIMFILSLFINLYFQDFAVLI